MTIASESHEQPKASNWSRTFQMFYDFSSYGLAGALLFGALSALTGWTDTYPRAIGAGFAIAATLGARAFGYLRN